MCVGTREEYIFFVDSVEPIISPWRTHAAKCIFALCAHTAYGQTVHWLHLRQRSWSRVGVFIYLWLCLSLFVIKPRITLNLLFFHLTIPQLPCYGHIIVLIHKLGFVVKEPNQHKGATFIPFIVKTQYLMAKALISLKWQLCCIHILLLIPFPNFNTILWNCNLKENKSQPSSN